MAELEPDDPRQIGGYRLLGRLGAGGMGLVYLGRSPAGMPVAIKVIHSRFARDPKFRARFRREVTAARAVSGAFTAPVIDADPDAESPWLVTTFLPGKPLNEVVAEHGPFPPDAVRRLGAGLAEALVSVHRAGIVHRDLKPHNVMLSPDGPRVIDFGIAHAADVSAITRAGAVVGSPGYMSPEQARGEETGPAGDVFSLGAVLAFAATGSGPFGRAQLQIMVYRVVHEQPRLEAVADPALRGWIAACLEKDPARRPTPQQLLAWFGEAPQGVSWLPGTVSEDIARSTRVARVGKGRRAFLVAALVAAVLPFAVSGAIWLQFTFKQVPQAEELWRFRAGAAITSAPVASADKVMVGDAKGVLHFVTEGRETARYQAGGAFSDTLTLSGHLLYAVSADGVLHAIEVGSAKARWTQRIGRGNAVPAVGGLRVYVTGATGQVLAFNALDGRREWTSPRFQAPSDPVTTRTGVYVQGSGRLQVLTPATGKVSARLGPGDGLGSSADKVCSSTSATGFLDCYAPGGQLSWAYRPAPGEATKSFRARPRPVGKHVFVTDQTGALVAIKDGTTDWRFAKAGPAAPVASPGFVYVSGNDGYLYALGDLVGGTEWRYPTGDRSGKVGPTVRGDTVYAAGGDTLYALKGRS